MTFMTLRFKKADLKSGLYVANAFVNHDKAEFAVTAR